MRASPLVQWVMFIVAWTLLSLPIIAITRTGAPPVQVQVPEQVAEPVWVSLRFSTPPGRVQIVQGDRTLWDESPAGDSLAFEQQVPIVFSGNGTEFWLRAEMAAGPAVVEIAVETSERETRAHTIWSSGGDIDEPLSFTWETHE